MKPKELIDGMMKEAKVDVKPTTPQPAKITNPTPKPQRVGIDVSSDEALDEIYGKDTPDRKAAATIKETSKPKVETPKEEPDDVDYYLNTIDHTMLEDEDDLLKTYVDEYNTRDGFFADKEGNDKLTDEQIASIKSKMGDLIDKKYQHLKKWNPNKEVAKGSSETDYTEEKFEDFKPQDEDDARSNGPEKYKNPYRALNAVTYYAREGEVDLSNDAMEQLEGMLKFADQKEKNRWLDVVSTGTMDEIYDETKKIIDRQRGNSIDVYEVGDDEILEDLADYEWQITDKTTVEDYVKDSAARLKVDPQRVMNALAKEVAQVGIKKLTPDMPMEKVASFSFDNKIDTKKL